MNSSNTIITLLLILFVGACGGPPANNPMLEEARSDYQQAESDSLIVTKAPVALKEAEEELEKSQQLWQNKADKKLIEHHAYIAQQKVKIAKQTALMNAAQDKVSQAQSERQKVLIQARKAEANASEQRAKKALSQAQQERQEAEEARKKAAELSKRVSELEAKQTARGLVLTLGDVLFDVNKANLKSGGQRAVTQLTNFLNEYKERNVLIEGHTDNTGSSSYNQQLSKRRADAVRQALINDGISGSRIQTRGLGEEYPKATNSTAAGRQQNRRVEVIISDKSGNIPERN